MPRQYKAAIIGLGGFSRMHAVGFSMVGRAKLIAGCDIDPAKPEVWTRRTLQMIDKKHLAGMTFYTDAAAMLDAERPDIVAITTKHAQHAPLTILCARHGVKGVICEKPIAMDLAEADAMLKACKKSGTKLAVGHQRRFNQEWQAAKKLIDKGTIGKVVHAVSRWPSSAEAEYSYALMGGGPLMWLSIHSIDLLRFILGDVAWVTGQVDMARSDIDTESQVYALLQMKKGAAVSLATGPGIGAEWALGHTIIFYGEKGTVHVSDGHGCRYKTRRNPKWREVKLDTETLPWQIGAKYAIAAQIKDMIEAIERRRQPRVSGEQARADLEAAMAIYESELTGGVVKLPLKKKTNPLIEMNRRGGYGTVTWKP